MFTTEGPLSHDTFFAIEGEGFSVNILEGAWLCFEDGFCKLPFVLVELVWFSQHGLWYCHQNMDTVSFSAFYCSQKEV